MKDRTAITVALVMTGKYDIPGKFRTVKGRDQYGEEKEDQIPELDHERLTADIDAMMKDLTKDDHT